jgi:limonene-1,2-epoxide hydrolase
VNEPPQSSDPRTEERLVAAWLDAFNRRKPWQAARLATPDLVIRLPEPSSSVGREREHRGRLATMLLLARVLWHSRYTLRMRVQAIESHDDGLVLAYTLNTAQRGPARLELEMTIEFRVRNGRIAEMTETVEDVEAWRAFWG